MRLRCYSFHSVKGGVGKSTLATACALALAERDGEPVVLIDMDLTGTSLGDVLKLEAPRWNAEHPVLKALEGPSDGFSSHEETMERVRLRQDEELRGVGAPPYLNDFLLFPAPERVDIEDADPVGLLWRLQRGPEALRIIPSSALPRDVEAIVSVVYDEERTAFLQQRLEYLMEALLLLYRDEPSLTLVFDTPPSIPGLSRAVLSLALRLGAQGDKRPIVPRRALPYELDNAEVRWIACLVATLDRQDRRALFRWLEDLPEEEIDSGVLRLLINKVQGSRGEVEDLLDPPLSETGAPLDTLRPPAWILPCGIVTDQDSLRFFQSDDPGFHHQDLLEAFGEIDPDEGR